MRNPSGDRHRPRQLPHRPAWFLTRWLLEISPGVFLGAPTARVRDILWAEVRRYSGKGRALLAYQTDNEQGFTFESHDHAWHPIDHEGLTLIHRPSPGGPQERHGSRTPRARLEQSGQTTAVREPVDGVTRTRF